MRRQRLVAIGIGVALFASACAGSAGGPPDIVVDRTACSHCTMLVSEPRYAAASQSGDAAPRVFDDIGCLLDAARQTGAPDKYWFQDAAGSGWIDGGAATFVVSSEIRSPMSGGILAYRDRHAADESARQYRGRVVASVAELMTLKGEQ